jgi:hypothetical protein
MRTYIHTNSHTCINIHSYTKPLFSQTEGYSKGMNHADNKATQGTNYTLHIPTQHKKKSKGRKRRRKRSKK